MKTVCSILILLISRLQLYGQQIAFDHTNLTPVQVMMQKVKLDGKQTLNIRKDTAVHLNDEATFVRFNDLHFKDGIIEVSVLSKLLPTAPSHARGFIGVAFRIDDNNKQFECIYIRPTNGRAEQQLRRNRSIQYFSFPHYKYDRLRKDSPGEYETYADMALNEWIHLKIEVKGTSAKLFINNNAQPALIVHDLKLGAHQEGAIGLFVDIGTDGYFADLKVSNN